MGHVLSLPWVSKIALILTFETVEGWWVRGLILFSSIKMYSENKNLSEISVSFFTSLLILSSAFVINPQWHWLPE